MWLGIKRVTPVQVVSSEYWRRAKKWKKKGIGGATTDRGVKNAVSLDDRLNTRCLFAAYPDDRN